MPCNEGNHAPNIEHDLEDPPMVVGSTYANMETFKLAISQHAIKLEFEFNVAKSAPIRFRAYCSRWIFASCTKDNCTVMVILCLCPYVNSYSVLFVFLTNCFSLCRSKEPLVLMTALVQEGKRG